MTAEAAPAGGRREHNRDPAAGAGGGTQGEPPKAEDHRWARGYVLLPRSLLEDPLWTTAPEAWLRVWLAILLRANWRSVSLPTAEGEINLLPGSLLTSSEKLAELSRTSRQQVRDALGYLESTGFATSKRTNRYTVITIVDWAGYHGNNRTGNQRRNQQRTNKEPAKEPTENQHANPRNDGPSEPSAEGQNRGQEPVPDHQKNHRGIQQGTAIQELLLPTLSQPNRGAEVREQEGPVSQVPALVSEDGFQEFREAAEAGGMSGSDVDWAEARLVWRHLDFEQRAAATQGIRDRVSAGEYSDPAFVPSPLNYLRRRKWQAPIRDKRAGPRVRSVAEEMRGL